MAWISTTNGNPARDRNSYCALSLLPRSNGTQCDGGGQRKEWKIETARLRGFGYPELYFSSMRKNGRGRVPITMDRGCGKKGHEGGGKKEKKKKSMDEASMGGELFKTDPYSTIRSTMISAVRAAHKRSRGRIIRGDFFILAAARLWGNPFGWMNEHVCSLSLFFSLPTSSTELTRHADSIAASVSITRAQAVAPAAHGHLQF